MAQVATSPLDRETGNIVESELTASRARSRNPSPRFANTDSSTSSVGGGGQCIRQGSGLRSHRSAQSWTKDAQSVIPPQRNATLSQNSNTAMQERDRHIRAIEMTRPTSEWYKLSGYTKRSMVENAVYRYKAIIGPEISGSNVGDSNELNTRIGCSRYSTRWLRSGCPIRTAPSDSATGTGRSAICSGPCNKRKQPGR